MIRRIRDVIRTTRDVAVMAWYLVGAFVPDDEPPAEPQRLPSGPPRPKPRIFTWNRYTVKVEPMQTPSRWEASVWLGGVLQYMACYERTEEGALAKAKQWAFDDHAWKQH
jgi:hypothetical protein